MRKITMQSGLCERRIEKIDQKEFRQQYEEEKEKTFKAIRWDWERQREIYMSKLW